MQGEMFFTCSGLYNTLCCICFSYASQCQFHFVNGVRLIYELSERANSLAWSFLPSFLPWVVVFLFVIIPLTNA